MLKVAIGHSSDPDSLEAVKEVIQQCRSTLAQTPQAGLLFAAIDFDHHLILQQINEAFPKIELIGGTTDGEISSILEFQQDSLTLMLFCADNIEFRASIGRNVSQNPEAIAQQAVETAKHRLTLPIQFCITVPESLTTSTVSILQGLKAALGTIPIFGGAAADQWQYKRTYQFFNTEVLSDAVPVLLVAGKLFFSYGVAGGWRPIGKRSLITKVNKNIIYEIDGKPALDFYHYYLNNSAPDAVYPLAVFPPGEEQFFLRGSVGHDLEQGSITVSGDIPEHSVVQITDASIDDVITASQTASIEAWAKYPGQAPEAALFFSCAWRRHILGTRANEEYQAIAHSSKQVIAGCGFYTYGEIAPLSNTGQTFFHNTTFVTLLIGSQ
ncbi:FIST N-terminal domain-containing protein [Gloeocapsopsis sp. IPPAS B-1203]|uniref:FIST signal transduction protein n=1 Tax=Gloeocapsopsis sp. IPPAS B-1203 TaxID=2049454 RepID=UPI000C1A2D14|nr:FIST N-terminal domain-containing protein [Gloeocapsopsis sp. IPPAS B-1203]PIG91197.1 hypothetical protein CSQ79_22370 [Gloeocapsopsis sp. IPPAS B-1203]